MEYNNPPLIITENGVSDNSGTMDDYNRINYYTEHVNTILKGTWLVFSRVSRSLVTRRCSTLQRLMTGVTLEASQSAP